MAQRATPSEFYRTRMQAQVTAPPNQPLPVVTEVPIASVQLPTLDSTAVFLLGAIALVGLIGLFALLGSSGKCRC